MNYIFPIFILISVLFSLVTGQTAQVSSAVLEGAGAGVSLAIRLAGPMCLWCGISGVMEEIGWMEKLSHWLTPLLRRLFPRAWENPAAREALCGNFSANLLGLGNAATPLGIRAVRQMAPGLGGIASDELCRLVVLNTASIQLIPATVAAVRSSLGAAAPFAILPAVWVTSLCAVCTGLVSAKVLSRWM